MKNKDIKISKDLCRFQKGNAVLLYDRTIGELIITAADYSDVDALEDLHEVLGDMIKYLKDEE